VEAFLRGPAQQATFRGFSSVQEARKLVKKHFDIFLNGETYSASAVADGRGCNSYCTITKSEDWFRWMPGEHRRESLARQLATTKALRRPIPKAGGSA
jgi:hypothetical protein